jgi:hypothetical protein
MIPVSQMNQHFRFENTQGVQKIPQAMYIIFLVQLPLAHNINDPLFARLYLFCDFA